MKIIFSRKGFDSSAGGCPSPIVDGQLVSLPIPTKMPTVKRYGELNGSYGQLVSDLTRCRLTAESWWHLDPDINPSSLLRCNGWRGAFGQVGTAQGHLAKQGVRAGDLFIFWGLFRPVEYAGRWKFVGRPEYRIWGWLHVGEVVNLGRDGSHAVKTRPWLTDHPHARAGWGNKNVLYIASEQLDLGDRKLPGFGVLDCGYCLSAGEPTPSTWLVPDWLNPKRGGSGMTYHPIHRWHEDGTVHIVAKGQEFIANPLAEREAFKWVANILSGHRASGGTC